MNQRDASISRYASKAGTQVTTVTRATSGIPAISNSRDDSNSMTGRSGRDASNTAVMPAKAGMLAKVVK